jgi:hypothetical protein
MPGTREKDVFARAHHEIEVERIEDPVALFPAALWKPSCMKISKMENEMPQSAMIERTLLCVTLRQASGVFIAHRRNPLPAVDPVSMRM